MSKTRKYIWLDHKFDALRASRGNACELCGRELSSSEGEFSHIEPTEVSGEGRGRYERYKDIKLHPESYRLACETCHDELDKRTYKRNIRALTPQQSSNAVKRAMTEAGALTTQDMSDSSLAARS